jgi:hypothetical protein
MACTGTNLPLFFGGGVKGPAAEATDAPQPCDEDEEKGDQFFFIFPSNGAPVE